MNYKTKITENRKCREMIKRINQKEGWVQIFSNNSDRHELTKCLIMKDLKGKGWETYSEAEFNKPYSGRCDIFAIKDGYYLIVEILDSETPEECLKKTIKYPCTPHMIDSIRLENMGYTLNLN
jgi:hypothetical protein